MVNVIQSDEMRERNSRRQMFIKNIIGFTDMSKCKDLSQCLVCNKTILPRQWALGGNIYPKLCLDCGRAILWSISIRKREIKKLEKQLDLNHTQEYNKYEQENMLVAIKQFDKGNKPNK